GFVVCLGGMGLGLCEVRAEAHGDGRVDAIARKMDRLYRSDSSRGRMTMKIKTPNYERALEMEIWTRGLEDTLVRIRSPRKEKGTSTLKKGREMWNYLPKIKKTIRVPPSMMMSGWMGSDFTNDDMVRESSWKNDYTGTLLPSPPSGQLCLEFRAKEDAPVAWDRVVTCVHDTEFYPFSQEFFDEKGRKARILTFSGLKDLGGRQVPSVMTLTPLLEDKKGNQTIVTYEEMEWDVEVSDSLFSLSRLRRGRE
ncbi:MAG: outer membrane lipoprotein-sorting protein, partial [Myxococcota bacterium]